MIGFLRGKTVAIKVDHCLLDVHGVGYRCFISSNTRGKLCLHEEIQLVTYMNVYQDGITLYGFADEEEYELFQLLISVSGIGPKVALGILSSITAKALCCAIQNKQTKALVKLPGIGKKSAERLILELSDKLSLSTDGDDNLLNLVKNDVTGDNKLSEAAEALVALGYSQAEFDPVLKKVTDCHSTEEIIKKALKALSHV